MTDWWTEQWSFGEGQSRTYCGIARTDEGYAVDVFRGDNCVASEVHSTHGDAARAARALAARYRRGRRPSDEIASFDHAAS